MTAFDHIATRIAELMTELAPARVPDYFDDMLLQSARTRQRPAWSSLERWLPMGVVARTAPVRQLPWRPIVVAAILVAVAAAVLVYAGTQPHVPAPFGPARNGVVAFATAAGDIMSVDPVTGRTTSILAGPDVDASPWFTPDGERFIFVRGTGAGAAWHIANLDGSGVTRILPRGDPFDWIDFTPDGQRLVVTPAGGGEPVVVNLADLTTTSVGAGPFLAAAWRTNHDQLLVTRELDEGSEFLLVNRDGTGLKRIAASPAASNTAVMSFDGASIAYTSFSDVDPINPVNPLHVLDLDSGDDRIVTPDTDRGYMYNNPQFSPDGKLLLAERYLGNGYRLAIVPVSGQGPTTEIGPPQSVGGEPRFAWFSPDGTMVMARFERDGSTWLLPVTGDNGRRIDYPDTPLWSWQRRP